MEFEEKLSVKAPIHDVWNYLVTNPENLIACIPGCEKIEKVGDQIYKGLLKTKIGPVSMQFDMETILSEIELHKRVKVKGLGIAKGVLGKLGELHYEGVVEFEQLSEEETEVRYRMSAGITGKLATFGTKIFMAKAEEMGKAFAAAIKDRLGKEV